MELFDYIGEEKNTPIFQILKNYVINCMQCVLCHTQKAIAHHKLCLRMSI